MKTKRFDNCMTQHFKEKKENFLFPETVKQAGYDPIFKKY